MLGLTRFTPWTELVGLHRDLDLIVGRMLDVKREGDTWMVSTALPGISPDKLDVEIVGRTLRVRGEIPNGRFERELILPEGVDAERVTATYRHGMLELVLPLKESAKPRRIEVQTAPETKELHAA